MDIRLESSNYSDLCPECGGNTILIHEKGDIVCSQCGLVINERIIDVSSNDKQVFRSRTNRLVNKIYKTLTDIILERFSSNKVITSELIQKEFIVNQFLKLRLENSKTNIYVAGKLFNQCKYLFLNIPAEEIRYVDEISSIDEAAEILDNSLEGSSLLFSDLTPEVEFWGHCSNIQAWFENGYNTNLLHRSLAFPLLNALRKVGDPLANKVFKEEIALRIESGFPSVILYLINQGYMKYLNNEELNTVLESPAFLANLPKWFFENDIPKWLYEKIIAKFGHILGTSQ